MAKTQNTSAIAFGNVPTIARVGKLVVGSTHGADVDAALRRSKARRKLQTTSPLPARSPENARAFVSAGSGTLQADQLGIVLQTLANDVESGNRLREGDGHFLREAARRLTEASTTLGKASETPSADRFAVSGRGTSKRAR